MKVCQPEPAAYEAAVAKKAPDLSGRGICGYVEVFGSMLKKQITDTSAYKVRNEAPLAEPVKNAQSVGTHLFS
jgi:hypothetical protein